MNFAAAGGHRSGRATPSLRDDHQRQLHARQHGREIHLSAAKRCADEAGQLYASSYG